MPMRSPIMAPRRHRLPGTSSAWLAAGSGNGWSQAGTLPASSASTNARCRVLAATCRSRRDRTEPARCRGAGRPGARSRRSALRKVIDVEIAAAVPVVGRAQHRWACGTVLNGLVLMGEAAITDYLEIRGLATRRRTCSTTTCRRQRGVRRQRVGFGDNTIALADFVKFSAPADLRDARQRGAVGTRAAGSARVGAEDHDRSAGSVSLGADRELGPARVPGRN